MRTINIEVTKNVYDVDLQQNVTTYDVTFEKGYYPLPSNIDLSNYYTKQEVIDNFKPISYNPNINEVITNGNTTNQSVIFQSSFGGSNWENTVNSVGNYFKKTNIGSGGIEEIVFGHYGITSSNSSGSTAIIFAPKTKDSYIIIPNENGTIVLDYQLNDYYTKTEVDTNLATKLDKPSTDGTFLVKKVGATISYEAFSGGGATKTTFTHDILVANWSLVSGKYEAVISNVGILADSFVDVIPSNDNVEIVRNAQIFPSVLVSAGSVKLYSKFLPSGTISVTVNII